ncbi:Zinc finger CCHC-type [Trinorchestia longiramus]|nr:Zinc finger CCHC-type [Trinorchestia longiramus]
MGGYATMLHNVEKEREEDLFDWVACASDIDESAMEDEQDGEWKTTRNSRKRKGKPVEESESQEGGKKKMHTSADGAESVKRLGKWTVNCSQPVSQMQSWGVMKGIHPSVNVEDVKASADCGSSELLSVARLPRYSGGIKEESSAIKLGFAGTQCPSHIYVGFTRYAVFPFNALCRCYRCQRLGHVAVNCNSPLCCLVCSGPHTKDECTAEPGQEKCANCHQTHIASSKECPAIRNAAAIQKLQCSGVGFEAAKHKVMKTD